MLNKADNWLDMCDEDLITARLLLNGNRFLPMGFFCHLIAEKALKAVVTNKTGEIPPKTHDLLKLAERGFIYNELSEKQKDFLENLMPYQIEGRYTEYKDKLSKTMTYAKSHNIFSETEDFLCWIKMKLGK